ncbi:MAG: TatD family hydrolase [Candidatus Absconditabacterales bacterium]
MKLFDSHTHLNTEPLLGDWQGYIQKFIDAGGVGLVNSGASESYNIQGIEIAKIAEHTFPNCIVKATLGRHPLECVEGHFTIDEISTKMKGLKDLCLSNLQYVVAIGETGIDIHYPNGLETLDIQKELFIQHCNLARELKLPLIVHSRDDFTTTFEILKNYTDLTVYFHCRGYGPQEYKILDESIPNLFVGFCGNVTYKNAQLLRDTLAVISLKQLLLETDAPYLTPQAVRGETNHPANVKYIYDFVAGFLKLSPEALSQQVESNFHTVYKI